MILPPVRAISSVIDSLYMDHVICSIVERFHLCLLNYMVERCALYYGRVGSTAAINDIGFRYSTLQWLYLLIISYKLIIKLIKANNIIINKLA